MKSLVCEPIRWVDNCSGTEDCALIRTPIANFAVYAQGNVLVRAEWVLEESPSRTPETEFLLGIVQQVNQYWQNPAILFAVPLLKQGTAFQRRVWQALASIPYNQTPYYSELARAINTGARAVGNACRNNPFPLFLPCHRVVSISGLGGYAGQIQGELHDIKTQLLAHEESFIK